MITIKHILCPVDFSDCSRQAARYAAAIARSTGASLNLLNVQSSAALAFAGPEMLLPVMVLTPELRAEIMTHLKQLVESEALTALPCECEVREGAPAEEILARVQTSRPDLLVLGTHGRSGFERLVLGSVAERVLRKASCPVVTVPLRSAGVAPAPAFERILCAIDFSMASMQALDYAISLAKRAQGSLTVLHVFELEGALANDWRTRLTPRSVREELHVLEAERRDKLVRAIPVSIGAARKVESCLTTGVPYREILHLAGEQRSDLIVMGVHGRSAAEMFFLGSTTNQVVRHATCPVLTVRTN